MRVRRSVYKSSSKGNDIGIRNALYDVYALIVLGLDLSRTTIAPVRRGINFVGYRTWARKRFVRKHSLYTLRRSVARGKLDSVVSVLGHARHTHSLRHMVATVRRRNPALYRRLPRVYRRVQ